jgi:hypothetical protein
MGNEGTDRASGGGAESGLGCGETGPTPLGFEREARVLVGGEALPASGCVRVEVEAAGAASERTCR